MQTSITAEEYFASFEQQEKAKKPSSPSRSPKRFSNPTFDAKLDKHLNTFSDNIMMNSSTNPDPNPPTIQKMSQHQHFNPIITTISGKTYAQLRQNRKNSGGPGRGSGTISLRKPGGLYGRGTARGGGGLGPVLDTGVMDHPEEDGKPAYIPFGTIVPSSINTTNTPAVAVTPDKMELDVESTLQATAAASSIAHPALVTGVVDPTGWDNNVQHPITSPSRVGFDTEQWYDAAEGDNKTAGSSSRVPIDARNSHPNSGIEPDIPSTNIITHDLNAHSTTNYAAVNDHTSPVNDDDGHVDYQKAPPSQSVGAESHAPRVNITQTQPLPVGRITNPYRGRNRRQNTRQSSRKPIICKYNIQVKPSAEIHNFQIESILSDILSAMQDVDPTVAILPHTDKSAPHITNLGDIPTTDSEMSKYVEDPRTSNFGNHGKLSARLTFQTTIPFPIIKRDARFAKWIRAVGIYFDKSELETTRAKYIGFFDKQLPHGTRIPFFLSMLQKSITISKPFQIISHLVNASDQTTRSDVSTYAYVMVASPTDEATILQEMSGLQGNHVKFYGWENFKSNNTSMADRENVLIQMRDYVTPHMSLLFNGFQENAMMRMGTAKPPPGPAMVAAGDNNMYSALQDYEDEDDAYMDDSIKLRIVTADPDYDDLDAKLHDVDVLHFIQEYFVDNESQEPIFVHVYGPANNQIEVHYNKRYHSQVQAVERSIHETLTRFMSTAAHNSSFSNDKKVAQTNTDYRHGATHPNDNNPGHTAKRKQPMFSYTRNSGDTYHSASVASRRKIDAPTMTLPTSTPTGINTGINIPSDATVNIPSYASVTKETSSITTTNTGNIITQANQNETSTITTHQSEFSQQSVEHITNIIRIEFVSKFTEYDKAIQELKVATAEAKKLATEVSTQLAQKQEEVITTIQTLRDGFDTRFGLLETESLKTNTLLEQLVKSSATAAQYSQQHHQYPHQHHQQLQYQHMSPQPFHPYYIPPVYSLTTRTTNPCQPDCTSGWLE